MSGEACCGVFKEAWKKLKGMKRYFWSSVMLFTMTGLGGFCILGLIIMAGQVIYMPGLLQLVFADPAALLTPMLVIPTAMWGFLLLYHLAQALFEMFVLMPMRMGIRLIPLRHVAGKSIHPLFAFKYFSWKYIWRFILLDVLVILAVGIPIALGGVLFCLPTMFGLGLAASIALKIVGVLFYLLALYLYVSYVFVSLLIIDRDIHPCLAMKLSRQAVAKKWFCIFGTLVMLGVIITISMIPFFIGLFWSIPYAQNVLAILYRNMLGIEGKDPVSVCEAKHNQ